MKVRNENDRISLGIKYFDSDDSDSEIKTK